MLSRVAESLFWIARSMERAENVARLIDTARRMVTLPNTSGRETSNEWSSVVIAAGATDAFSGDVKDITRTEAIELLVFDRDNPSSIYNSIRNARENARAVRFGVTTEVWTSLNMTWGELKTFEGNLGKRGELAAFVDWVKSSHAQFRGAVEATLVRDDSLQFIRLGSFIERADATARILDVKYHVLLPSLEEIGGGLDEFQWISLLQAVGVHRAYHFVTRKDVSRDGVTEYLIKNEINPRSLAFCLARSVDTLNELQALYGVRHACHNTAEDLKMKIQSQTIEEILAQGLHEFLTQFIADIDTLSSEISSSFAFVPPVLSEPDAQSSGQSQTLGGMTQVMS